MPAKGYSIQKYFPENIRFLIRWWIYAHLILFFSRLVWFIFNQNLFGSAIFFEKFSTFCWGFYFDLPVVFYYYLPVWILILFAWKKLSKVPALPVVFFVLGTLICLLLNGIDTGYSSITGKRSGVELLYVLTDKANSLGNYWKEVAIGLTVIIAVVYFLFRYLLWQFKIHLQKPVNHTYIYRLTLNLFVLVMLVFAARGGWRLRPLAASNVAEFVGSDLVPLASSTPLQMLTATQPQVMVFPSSENLAVEAEQKLGLLQSTLHPRSGDRPNVVLLVVESLGREYTGFLNNAPYTPFLDSFSKQCQSFTYCYANGTRSNEMASAIFSGVPTLSPTAIINSSYAGNHLPSLFRALSVDGYSTHFFHGTHNQTMGFKSFFNWLGLQHYYGIDEYPENLKMLDHDGSWGILDEPYLKYTLRCMDTMKGPFFSTVFTLSSHHPYFVPAHLKAKLPKGKLPILQSMAYTDYALRQFFEVAKTKPWFGNTYFIITGDHTSYGQLPYFYSESGHYEVPLLIYGPGIKPGINPTNTSHCGIGSTILDLCKTTSYFWPEKSAFWTNDNNMAIHYNPDKNMFFALFYPYTLGVNTNGDCTEFYSRIRNSSEIKKLPLSGAEFERIKQQLIYRLRSYNYRLNYNAYPKVKISISNN